MNKKKLKIFVVSLLLLLAGIGICYFCVHTLAERLEQETASSLSMITQWFTGTREKSIEVEDGRSIAVTMRVDAAHGKLYVVVTKDGEPNRVFEGNSDGMINGTVRLTEPGDYTLHVKGRRFSGTYLFKWTAVDSLSCR